MLSVGPINDSSLRVGGGGRRRFSRSYLEITWFSGGTGVDQSSLTEHKGRPLEN